MNQFDRDDLTTVRYGRDDQARIGKDSPILAQRAGYAGLITPLTEPDSSK